ncbi:MAG: hypothetical protein ABIP94_09925 [Planctomycetota bacterium]
MSSFDQDLLQRLAYADAVTATPPGVGFTPEHLALLAHRRARRQLSVLAAALLVIVLMLVSWPQRSTDDGAAAATRTYAQLHALGRQFAELQATLREWSTNATDAAQRSALESRRLTAASTLRFELAKARASAVLALAPPSPTPESKR